MAQFLINEPDKDPRAEGIKLNRVTLGRAPERTVRLDDKLVANKHAVVTYQKGKYYIEDLDSFGGVFVNGERVTKAEIKLGDEIKIGNTILTLQNTGVKPMKRWDKEDDDIEEKFRLDRANPKTLKFAIKSDKFIERGLFSSAIAVLFGPKHFFNTVPPSNFLLKPSTFQAIVFVLIGLVISFKHFYPQHLEPFILGVNCVISALLAAIGAMIVSYVIGLEIHLPVMLLGGEKPLSETLSVMAYSSVALLMVFVPSFAIIGFLLWFGIVVRGMATVHEFGWIRTGLLVGLILLILVGDLYGHWFYHYSQVFGIDDLPTLAELVETRIRNKLLPAGFLSAQGAFVGENLPINEAYLLYEFW